MPPQPDLPVPERRRIDRRQTDHQAAQIRRWLEDLTESDAATYVRVSVVARYFAVDRRTVEKWDGEGLLLIRHFPSANRIALSDVLAFKEKHHPSEEPPPTKAPDPAPPVPMTSHPKRRKTRTRAKTRTR